MKMKSLWLTALMSVVAMLAGCSSPHQVTTRDGQTIITSDRPEVDEDSGFVTYERDGAETHINKSDVREIREID